MLPVTLAMWLISLNVVPVIGLKVLKTRCVQVVRNVSKLKIVDGLIVRL